MSTTISVLSPEARLEVNSYDVEAWNLLLREAAKKPIDEARPFYERLVAQFPTAGRYWKAFVEHELRAQNFENVEKIFTHCLRKVLQIDLWRCYLKYVRETKSHVITFREQMAQAYDFALEKVGVDMLSYPIYSDYISFLKTVQAVGQYAENQKITAMRKVYQRGIATPMLNIEQLWAEYCSFEKGINSQLAEKLIQERNKDYMNAKKVSKAMETVTRGLNRQTVSVPPKGTAAEVKQKDLWKKFIVWEKENQTATEDFSYFSRRVIYTYEQSLLCLGYHVDLWYEAALFMHQSSKTLGERGDAKLAQSIAEDVGQLYERATTGVLRNSLLMHFAYADYEEERRQFQKVQTIYNRVIDMQHLDPSLAYIQQMRFSRRTEGIKAARAVFKKAREDTRATWHVYVAAALLEYYCSKDTAVAMRIFELGLKKHGDKPDFALCFIDFLSHLNEDNNTRVLFERILTSGNLPAERSLEVWDRYLSFESQVGDLSSILKVDKRRRDALQKETKNLQTLLLIDRYKFIDLLPCTNEQLRFLSTNTVKPGAINGVSDGRSIFSGMTNGSANSQTPISAVDLAQYPRPNLSQMVPFKPKIITTSSYHPVPGGIFPPPPAVAHLLSLLPPPWCFTGPFVDEVKLMEEFRNWNLPQSSSGILDIDVKMENGAEHFGGVRMEDVKKSMYQIVATVPDPLQLLSSEALRGTKRSRDLRLPAMGNASSHGNNNGNNNDSEEDDVTALPPSHDVYRQRKMMKKT